MKIAIFILAVAQLSFILSNAERTGGPSSPFEFVTFLILLTLPSLIIAKSLYVRKSSEPPANPDK